MPSTARFLQSSAAEPPVPLAVDSDVVVVLASLLCALICVVGLALVARCAWLRRSPDGGAPETARSAAAAPQNKGLKKKVLRALPMLSFDSSSASIGRLADCAICLTEFADGDEVRVLPQCGHGFHAACVDTWLGSHSSCPSCRQSLIVSQCRRCGASPSTTSNSGAGEDRHQGTQ